MVEVDGDRARAVAVVGGRAAQNDARAALVDPEIVCKIGSAAAADFLCDLQPREPLIGLQVLGPALVRQREGIQLRVVLNARPVVVGVVADVRNTVHDFPVALKAPLIAIERVLAAVEHKAVLAVRVAHGAAAGGDHAVGRAGGLHDAPDFVIGGRSDRRTVKTDLDIDAVAVNGFYSGDDAALGNALILAAGADGDDIADLQRTLGNDNGGLGGQRAGHGDVGGVQVGDAAHLALHVPRAVNNDHQVGQHLKVSAGIDAVGLTPKPGRSQELRDRLVAGGDNARDAVQLAVRADAAGERGQVALLLEGAVRVLELPRCAESRHRHSRHARIDIQHAGDIEQRHLNQHLAVRAILNVAGLALVGIDRDRAVRIQRAAAAPHARPRIHAVKVVLPGAGIRSGGEHKLRSCPRPRARAGAAGEVYTVECSANSRGRSLGRCSGSSSALARLRGAGLCGSLGRVRLCQVVARVRQQRAELLTRAGVAVRLGIGVGGYCAEVGGKNGTISHGSVPPNSCH